MFQSLSQSDMLGTSTNPNLSRGQADERRPMTNLNKRLLIVDDEQRNLRLLEGMLYAEPYDLMLAHSGAEALDLVRDNPPDLILLDVMMPGMSGFEVCK